MANVQAVSTTDNRWWTVAAIGVSVILVAWCAFLALFAPYLVMLSDSCGDPEGGFICSVTGQWTVVLIGMVGAPLVGLLGLVFAWTRRSPGVRLAVLVGAGVVAYLTYPIAHMVAGIGG